MPPDFCNFTFKIMNNIESAKGEIVMYQPDETVWLSQAQMAELFDTKRQAITKHLQNIYDCEELNREAKGTEVPGTFAPKTHSLPPWPPLCTSAQLHCLR